MSIDYSIIIPAYNEEFFLDNTLVELKKAMAAVPLKGQVIVVNNNSTDRTANIAYAAGATVIYESKNQISRARNTGARHATGRYFIFVDADTIVPAALLQKALDNLESGKCCGGGATVTFDSNMTPAIEKVLNFWNTFSRIFRLAAGCFVYCHRDDFKSCGGFSEKVYASEEIWFSMALKRAGKKSKRNFRIIKGPKVITSGRKQGWYTPRQQLGLVVLILLFPFLIFSKKYAATGTSDQGLICRLKI